MKGFRRRRAAPEEGRQKRQPSDQEPAVVADGGEHGVDRIPGARGERVAAHAGLGLEVPDHRLNRGAAPEGALEGGGEPALLPATETRKRSPSAQGGPGTRHR